MFHRWQILLGVLVYRGKFAPPPDYRSSTVDFITEEKFTAHTVFVQMGAVKAPLFHAHDEKHAARLMKDHALQSPHYYTT